MIIDHIGIVVRSIEQAIDLWRRAFGYEPLTLPVINTRQKVRVVFLKKSGSPTIKLVEPTDPSSPVQTFSARGGGLHHLCFQCEDLDHELNRLQQDGARILAAPQPAEGFDNERIAFAYIGQGLNVELIETGKKTGLLQK